VAQRPEGFSDAEYDLLCRLKSLCRTPDEAGGNQQPRTSAETEFKNQFPLMFRYIRRALPLQQPAHAAVLDELVSWRRAMIRGDYRPGGVIIGGKLGRGKTCVASCAAYYAAALAGLQTSWLSCADMRRHLRGRFDDRELDQTDFLHRSNPERFQVAVMDDVGIEAGNREAEELVKDIIDQRYGGCAFTILTTNKAAKDFAHYLGDRHSSRATVNKWIELPPGIPDLRRDLANRIDRETP
jgi:DNA replication protein DnaC